MLSSKLNLAKENRQKYRSKSMGESPLRVGSVLHIVEKESE